MAEDRPATVKEDLQKALEYVEQGWCQHAYQRSTPDPDGGIRYRYCALGAIKVAVGMRNSFIPGSAEDAETLARILAARQKLYDVLDEPHCSDTWIEITEWNDRPERTKDEVIDLFRKAIASIDGN
jgi:hypothetical protein